MLMSPFFAFVLLSSLHTEVNLLNLLTPLANLKMNIQFYFTSCNFSLLFNLFRQNSLEYEYQQIIIMQNEYIHSDFDCDA